jgi:hypothetical protein
MLSFTRLQFSLYENLAFVYMFCLVHIDPCEKIFHIFIFSCFWWFYDVKYSGYTSQAADTITGTCSTCLIKREILYRPIIFRLIFFHLIHVHILLWCFEFFRSWYFLNHSQTEKCCFYNNNSIHTRWLNRAAFAPSHQLIHRWNIWILLKKSIKFLNFLVQSF